MKEKRYDIDRMIMESNYLNSIEKDCSNNGGSCAEMERQMYLDIINDLIERVKSQEAKDAENKKFIEEMRRSLEASRKEVKDCLLKIEKLEDAKEENDLNKQTIYGSKSQKGTKDKPRSKKKDRDEESDDFDGTSGSVEDKDETDSEEETSDKASSEGKTTEDEDSGERPYRKGVKYNKMKAAKLIYHKCDTTDIPEGYTIFKFVERSEFTRVSYIKEDRYQIAILKNEEGETKDYYKPTDKDDGKLPCEDTVEGTHATPEFLSDLAVNKFQLQQPFYRELVRMANEKMQICEQTLINWLTKGAEYLNCVLPYLRSTLLSKGANLNCDETWCRVRIRVPRDKNGA